MTAPVTEIVDNGELDAYIDPDGRWRAAIVNIEIPRSVYLTVDYTEGLDQAFTRASYGGVVLKVEWAGKPEQVIRYATGDFAADYNSAREYVEGFGQADSVIPFYASSSLDGFMFEAGYEEAATEAYLAENEAEAERAVEEARAAGGQQRIDQAVATLDTVAKLNAALDGGLPREKLVYALAKVIATDDYNTSYPGAPLGRAEALDALDVLKNLLAGVAV